ncbi:replicative DNA helicase [Pseudomonas aeruginosa]|uniref:DnaB-like helicase N-terminal domain-containing protein n=1 Tax=Pseudomonas aeruginosa TaxID=287 RepID=UPI0007176D2B|nr:DnaB-like helicase N-terminal domain-containing protein [Pseudomonas aeruginosa]KRV02460.1 hypothetical protein AN455_11080 [Pseudomonas aeruginosa]KRV08267.1 hypothetical protein AN456_11910 [Pseudomonas aeruginosa]SQC54709.1 replicative DNA helicase [Pseudomonas aeruginosa]
MEMEDGLGPIFEATAELAEKYLLGYLMLNSDAWWDAAKEKLNPGDFAGYVNCRIYLAMEELMSEGSPIDVITLTEYLEGDERYQEAGGLQLIAELATSTPIRRGQVAGLSRLLRGFGLLRSSLGPRQRQRAVCSLLAAKANGWPHGKSWVATIEDLVRNDLIMPGELLGQRVCYVYGKEAVAPLLE